MKELPLKPYVFLIFLAIALPAVHPPLTHGAVFLYPRGLSLSYLTSGALPKSLQPVANYDEQLGETFTSNFSSLAVNVTAVEQADTYGYGPAYLLNGLSSTGYWYQVGLSYNWPNSEGGGYNAGFNMVYEVYSPNGNSIFPQGGGGLMSFSGPVYPGNTVLLSLSFSGGNVVMEAVDIETGASAEVSYSAEGAAYFQGLSEPSNSKGFFTGLMT
ncbi:MAG: hypothetical protein ACP5NC_05890, partial [Nitrososphaeria archaeon]